MRTRRDLLRAVGAAGTLPVVTAQASAATAGADESTRASDSRTTPLDGKNPWPERRVLNIGHRGGLFEVPENTLFGLKYAAANGIDMFELDLNLTANGTPVVLHDETVDRTTDGSGDVGEKTLAEIKQLDAAYWFVEGAGMVRDKPEGRYRYRGLATGDRPIPGGLQRRVGVEIEPNDFRIPTFEEALDVVSSLDRTVHLTITLPETRDRDRLAKIQMDVARLLYDYDRVGTDIVASFRDSAMERFKMKAPDIHTSSGVGRTAAQWASSQGPAPGAPGLRYDALQVPLTYNGLDVVTESFVQEAHANGYAVHVWVINDRETMEQLLEIGVDGIMTDRPTLLADVLEERGVTYRGPASDRDSQAEAHRES